MNLSYGYPAEYLKAKLILTEEEIAGLPDVRMGYHGGRPVYRECIHGAGKRKVCEYSADGNKGKLLFSQSEHRKELIKLKKQLKAAINGFGEVADIDLSKVNTIYNKSMWERIRIRSEFEKKEKGYDYKGMILDSRAEMIVAQCLDSMGLSYKYEPRIIIGGEIYYPDFIVYLPEFQRCFFIEFLGKLNDLKYITRNEFKLMDYLNSGMIVNLDLLLFCGFEDRMVNADDMKDDIMALIRKYCRLYRA